MTEEEREEERETIESMSRKYIVRNLKRIYRDVVITTNVPNFEGMTKERLNEHLISIRRAIQETAEELDLPWV